MSTWSKSNIACKNTWIFLRALGQLTKVFKDSGNLKMTDLTFWNQTVSQELREIAAKTLVNQLDNMFRLIDKAVFEEGVTITDALNDMYETMINPEKTVADLAGIVDACYNFVGE